MSNQYEPLEEFLKKNTTEKGTLFTHTRIGDKDSKISGGLYNIKDKKSFLETYYKHVFDDRKKEYLTEKQRMEDAPLVIDIDMRYDTDITERQYTKDHIIDLIDIYAKTISKIFSVDNMVKIEVFVMEKSGVNILDTKYEKSFKQLLGINNLNKYFDPIMKVVKHNAYDLPERWMGGKKDCSHKASKNDPTRCAVCTAIYGIEPGFDLRVGPGYIMHVYNSLFFLSSVIYRQTLANISNKKSYVQNTDIFNGVLHDHMVYGLNSDLSLGLTYGPPLEIVTYCDTSVSNEHDDITIVNHILCLNELYIHHNAIVSDDADSDPKIDLMEQIVRELEKINNKDKKSIVQSYIDQDFTKYLEKASKMSDKSSFQSWFMTQKFLKNKKFKVAFNKLN